jgi:hypothetical protein
MQYMEMFSANGAQDPGAGKSKPDRGLAHNPGIPATP